MVLDPTEDFHFSIKGWTKLMQQILHSHPLSFELVLLWLQLSTMFCSVLRLMLANTLSFLVCSDPDLGASGCLLSLFLLCGFKVGTICVDFLSNLREKNELVLQDTSDL